MKAQLEQVKISNTAHPLTNFEIQQYYQNELKFDSIYSRNNLSNTAWKVSKYGVFSGPYFPECGKICTRKNSVFGHFSCSVK